MIRQKRNEGRHYGAVRRSRQRQTARSRKPPPIVNLLRPASMTKSQLSHHSTWDKALHHNARLDLIRPAPALLTAGVKRGGSTISDSAVSGISA